MSKVQNGPILNYKDMYKISRMRILGHTWKDIKAAMPHKNIYEKYVRLAYIMNHVTSNGQNCTECGAKRDISIYTYKGTDEEEARYLRTERFKELEDFKEFMARLEEED